jgi:hypothetical protein
MVREWDRLDGMFCRIIEGDGWNMKASKEMYDAMRPLVEEGRLADGWVEESPGYWRKGKKPMTT